MIAQDVGLFMVDSSQPYECVVEVATTHIPQRTLVLSNVFVFGQKFTSKTLQIPDQSCPKPYRVKSLINTISDVVCEQAPLYQLAFIRVLNVFLKISFH